MHATHHTRIRTSRPRQDNGKRYPRPSRHAQQRAALAEWEWR